MPTVTVRATPEDDDNGYQARRASVATRTDAALIEVPQSVTVITHQALEDRQPASLDEAIATASGVKQANSLGGTQDAILKRGFGTNRDNSVMRDGMQSVQARNFTPTTERVEILKGPTSMLYGIQDPGGVINVVTKKPQLEARRSFAAGGTSWGGGGAQIDVTGPITQSGIAYRLIAERQSYDYWRNFGDISQTVMAPSLAWYGSDTAVSLAYEHMDYSVPFDRGTQIDTRTGKPLAIPRERRLDEPFNETHGYADSVNLRGEHALSDAWSLRANYGYSGNHYNDYQSRVISLNPVTGAVVRRGDATRDANQDAHSFSVYGVGKQTLAGQLHEVLVGFDLMQNYRVLGDLIRDPQDTGFNLYHPVYGQVPLPSRVSPKDSDQTDKLRTHAFYLQDSVYLGNWILVGGVRYDEFDELTGKGRPFSTNADVHDSKLVPRAGVVYKIQSSWSLYGGYAESFRPNTSIATPIGVLPPEEGRSWELGSKYETAQLSATLALFNIDKRNIQTTVRIDGEDFTRVSGKARSRGSELDVSGRITPSWSVIGSYSFTDAKVTEDPILQGLPLDGVSEHAGALYVTYDFRAVPVRAGLGGRAFSKWSTGDGNGALYWLPAGEVVDAFFAYEMKKIHWQLNAKNVLNSTYYTSSSGAGAPAIVIGETRQFLLRARMDF